MHATTEPFLKTTLDDGSGLLKTESLRVPAPRRKAPVRGPQSPPFKLGRALLILAVLLVIGVIAGLWPRLHQRHQTYEETRALSLATVRVAQPAPAHSAIPISLSGELRPLVEAPLYARATGYVRQWDADIGAQVKEGQPVAELETPELDRELLAARAESRQAEAARVLAETTAKRWTQLLLGKTVSPQEAEEKSGDFAVKTAAAAAARANVERLEQLAGFNKITAPFAGTITARHLDVGQLVTAGSSQELFRLADVSKLRLFVRVPQSYARSVTPDQKAQIVLPELPGRTFTASVVRTAGSIDAVSRTLLTELEVPNERGELLAGSYVQVRLADTLPDAALTVPSNALLFRAEGPQIGVVDAQNHVALHKVILGRDYGAALEILDGIQPNDRVVLNPPDSLNDGVEVHIAEDAPPSASGPATNGKPK